MKVLITGRPGVGKTTAVLRLVEHLRARGGEAVGIYTVEIRGERGRLGFKVVDIARQKEAVFAHVDLPRRRRVGRYGVDTEAFEAVALPALDAALEGGAAVIVDEVGRMELFSRGFRDRVERLFEREGTLVATIPSKPIPFVTRLMERYRPFVWDLTPENRNEVVERLLRLLDGPRG